MPLIPLSAYSADRFALHGYEAQLAAHGMTANIVAGVLDPIYALSRLAEVAGHGNFTVWGLWIPETALVLPAWQREMVGTLLRKQRIERLWVADELSQQWLAHFGLDPKKAQVCPSWEWLLTPVPHSEPAPCLSPGPHEVAQEDAEFTVEYDALLGGYKAGGYNDDHINARVTKLAARGVRERAGFVATAQTLLREMRSSKVSRPVEALAATFGPPTHGETPIDDPTGPRTLVLGSLFDPATHYTAHYYDGRGLRFARPDGAWDIYHGTGLSWDGFDTVAQILARHLRDGERLLDVGCSNGDFVRRARAAGVDAVGVDLSSEAIGRADVGVKPYLSCADVTQQTLPGGPFAVVTAWDFWEHIFASQVGPLAQAVARQLKPGGRLYAVICTRSPREQDWTIPPGTKFSPDNSWLLASGHVTIRTWWWWRETFQSYGLVLDKAATLAVDVHIAEEMGLAPSWSPRHVIVVRRAA